MEHLEGEYMHMLGDDRSRARCGTAGPPDGRRDL
jgi:hypothetical protein